MSKTDKLAPQPSNSNTAQSSEPGAGEVGDAARTAATGDSGKGARASASAAGPEPTEAVTGADGTPSGTAETGQSDGRAPASDGLPAIAHPAPSAPTKGPLAAKAPANRRSSQRGWVQNGRAPAGGARGGVSSLALMSAGAAAETTPSGGHEPAAPESGKVHAARPSADATASAGHPPAPSAEAPAATERAPTSGDTAFGETGGAPGRGPRAAPDLPATIAAYLRNEGEHAIAHLTALSRVRSPTEFVTLQVGEFQRAADASLNCMTALMGVLSRSPRRGI